MGLQGPSMGCWRGSSARGLVPLLRTRRFLEAGARAAALCLSQVWVQGPGWGWEHVRREGATLCFLVGCLDAALPHTCLRPSSRPASPPPSPAAPGDAAGRGVHLHMMQRQPYLLPNRALASPFPRPLATHHHGVFPSPQHGQHGLRTASERALHARHAQPRHQALGQSGGGGRHNGRRGTGGRHRGG